MAETATAEAPAKAASGGNLLQVRNLEAWYGESHILHGINFDVNAGEVVTLLGRNVRRQDHHAEVDHGHHRQAHRLGEVQ
ncbi:Fe-S cluster assembly ATPase SufC [Bradyrhizobium sp. GM22.5]